MDSQNDLAQTLHFAQVPLDGRSKREDQSTKHGRTKHYPIMTYAFHLFFVVDKRMLATYLPRMRNSNQQCKRQRDWVRKRYN